MIRILLTKYWVLAHLLVTASTLCFNPTPSMSMALWSASSLLLMLLCLPPVFRGESLWLARQRVQLALRGDAVLWMSVCVVLYVGVQILNAPRTLEYAVELRRWVFSAPPLEHCPSTITAGDGVGFFTGLLGGLAMAIAVRCALPRKQRLAALIGVCALTGLLAVGSAIVTLFQGEAPTFAWLGGAYDVGVLWLLTACVALGIVGEAFLECHKRTLMVAFAVACANLFGVFAFAPALIVCMGALVVVGWFAFSLVAVQATGRGLRFVWRNVLLLPPLFAMGLGLILVPGPETLRPVLHLSQWADALETFWAQWLFRAELAMDVLGAHPMLGAGPNGFEQSAHFYVKGKLYWSYWKSGGTGLPCDFLRLLTSCGLIGTLLLLLPGGAMLGRCMMRWAEYQQANRRHYSLRYIVVLVGSLVGVVGTLIAALFGTPLHSPATLGVFLLVCSCMGGWMPRPRS